MTLLQARPDVAVSGEEVLPGKANYLLGNDPQSWRTNVATYGKVKYKNVYQGIDLVYYGNQRSLEYDFHLAPGANPEEIRLGIEGVKRTEIDSVTGDLIMRFSSGEVIRQHKPVLYQEVDGARRAVAGRFVFRGRNQIGFEVGAYDKSRALVIDPVLVYTTYFGGEGDEATTGIAVDSTGSVYVSGAFISSPGFPVTPNAFQKTQNNSNGNGEVFITKFTPDGAGMVYSTLLGGSSTDTSTGIALDTTGNAYVVGWTDSADFPIRNAFQSTLRGFPNAFVTKLNTTGSDLLYSTFLGGSSNFDFGTDIAVDPSGNAFITGDTASTNFPVTTGALRTTLRFLNPGERDGFVAKFNTNAAGEASLVFSTFFDINDPFSNSIDIDDSGNPYITGDARVQKLNAAGSALVYSFIIPDVTTASNSRLHTTDIAVDGSGQAYVTGFETRFAGETSPTLKIVNGFQPMFGGGLIDGFLVKVNTVGTALLYSTYLGGTNIDLARAVAVDSTGKAYLVGETASADFPTRDAFQTIDIGGGNLDLFIAKIDTNATGTNSLIFSTYYGASNFDEAGSGVAIDGEGNIYATGYPFKISLSGIIHTGSVLGDDSQGDPFILKIANTSSNVIRFGSERLSISEAAGSFEVTVVREGDSSAAANVDFATLDGRAQHSSDYTSANGTLSFAPGETAKTFRVLITDDTTPEPNETLFVILREKVEGVALAAPSVAELTIIDDDAAEACAAANPIDCANFFIRQQYLDFLEREPEPAGLQFYLDILNGCNPSDTECVKYTRGALSANFFRSPEFGRKGAYIANLFNIVIGQRPKTVAELSDPNKVERPHYAEFMADLATLSTLNDDPVLTDQKKHQLASAWLARTEVQAILPSSLSNQQFVQKLESIAGVTLVNESTLIANLNNDSQTRAQVLRAIAESNEVVTKFYIPNFVTMEYLGYLRRDPENCHVSSDPENCGFIFHNRRFNTPGANRDLIENIIVRGFIESPEYRRRFGS
ncbi:MAG TPA: SBBP repeat-containing protein [Pyrinomonadaceae bacterium]